MKLICLKNNLKSGVNIAEKLVGKNITLPILSNFLLTSEEGFLKITATDLELGINVSVNAKVEKKGSVTVSAKLFSNIVNNFTEDKLTLESKDKNLKIYSKNTDFQIVGSSPKDFPILPKIEEEKLLELDAGLIQRSLTQVASAASFSEARPELAGVLFKITKSQIRVVATDSFRLAEKTIHKNFKTNNDSSYSFILPLRAVQEVIRILDGKDTLSVKISKNQTFFEVENISLLGRLVEGDYPDYEQILPKSHETKVILKREELANSVRLASFFSSKVNDIKLNCDPDSDFIEIASSDSDRGQSALKIKAKIQGKKNSLSFNYRYLIDGLNNIDDEEVALELNDESSPTVLRPVSDEPYLYLIMPIKSI
jgi:DNA polymerase-3 subunit beta